MGHKTVNAFLLTASLGCAAVAVFHVSIGVPVADPWLFPLLVVLPAALALGFALALRMPLPARLNVVLLLSAVLTSLYVVDAVLEVWPQRTEITLEEAIASRSAVFDRRTKLQVAADLRATGVDAYIALPANILRAQPKDGGARVMVGGRSLIPLALERKRVIVHCNESGKYALFRTGEMGFNNPPDAWRARPELTLVGDSFIEGACVDSASTLPAKIRRDYPTTLALGLDGAGPLSELGLIEEYLPRIQPRVVVWFYYEGNDLSDLTSELLVPELRAYLDGTTQGLVQHADVLDSSLIEEFRHFHYKPPPRQASRVTAMGRIGRWLRLSRLRQSLALGGVAERVAACCNLEAFGSVLRQANKTVQGWGGQFYVVYLPAPGRYSRPLSGVFTDELRQRGRVLGLLRDLRIPVIDVSPAFEAAPNRAALYFDERSHYTPAGYALAAETVVRQLRRECRAEAMTRAGLEPATYGLKVRCSTS